MAPRSSPAFATPLPPLVSVSPASSSLLNCRPTTLIFPSTRRLTARVSPSRQPPSSVSSSSSLPSPSPSSSTDGEALAATTHTPSSNNNLHTTGLETNATNATPAIASIEEASGVSIGLSNNSNNSDPSSPLSSPSDTDTLADLAHSSLTVDEISNLVHVVQECDLADFRYEHKNFVIEITCRGGLGFDKDGNLNSQPLQPTAIQSGSVFVQDEDNYSTYDNDQQDNYETNVVQTVDRNGQAASNEVVHVDQQSEESPVDLNDPDQIYESDFVVTSNRVGFFFSGAKNKPPLVNVGDSVAFNQPVCIIEQLGQQYVYLSEAAGKVVKLFVEDGDAVEFATQIMVIRPD